MESLVETWKRESVSCSVMSNSLQPHGLPGILQARILEWVDIPFSRSWIVKTLSCGIWDLVPPPGITPGLPALGAWSVKTLDHQRSPSFRVFYLWYSVVLPYPMFRYGLFFIYSALAIIRFLNLSTWWLSSSYSRSFLNMHWTIYLTLSPMCQLLSHAFHVCCTVLY